MMITVLAKLFASGLLVWFGLLALLVAVRILRGDIRVSGFLSHQQEQDGNGVDPERALAMAVFPAVLGMYVLTALQADMSVIGSSGRPVMPDVPEYLLAVLTGGNSLYLAGKITRRN